MIAAVDVVWVRQFHNNRERRCDGYTGTMRPHGRSARRTNKCSENEGQKTFFHIILHFCSSQNRVALTIAVTHLPAAQKVRSSVGVKLSDYSDAWGRKEFTDNTLWRDDKNHLFRIRAMWDWVWCVKNKGSPSSRSEAVIKPLLTWISAGI